MSQTVIDPLNQLLLKDIIQEKREEGKTIVFSTHQMEQVERLCTNICLINKGKIIVEGVLDDIRKAHTSDAVEVRYSGKLDNHKTRSFFTEVEIKESSLSGILRKRPDGFLSWVNDQVIVESFQVKVPNLEQIFIEEVKKTS